MDKAIFLVNGQDQEILISALYSTPRPAVIVCELSSHINMFNNFFKKNSKPARLIPCFPEIKTGLGLIFWLGLILGEIQY